MKTRRGLGLVSLKKKRRENSKMTKTTIVPGPVISPVQGLQTNKQTNKPNKPNNTTTHNNYASIFEAAPKYRVNFFWYAFACFFFIFVFF